MADGLRPVSLLGELLARKNPTQTTLYLPGQELTRTTTTTTGTRYYTFADTLIGIRKDTTAPQLLLPDNHGTPTITLTWTNTNPTITTRYQDPYGNTLTTTPWIDQHGFLNLPTNTTTGLTDIGARTYDPATGRFLSADPLIAPQEPASLASYSYAGNAPTSSLDPSGAVACDDDGGLKACRFPRSDKAGNDNMTRHDAVAKSYAKLLALLAGKSVGSYSKCVIHSQICREYPIPGGSLANGTGEADIADLVNYGHDAQYDYMAFLELYEVKKSTAGAKERASAQLNRYIEALNSSDGVAKYFQRATEGTGN